MLTLGMFQLTHPEALSEAELREILEYVSKRHCTSLKLLVKSRGVNSFYFHTHVSS